MNKYVIVESSWTEVRLNELFNSEVIIAPQINGVSNLPYI